jgi:hypothetical protein
MRSANTHDYTIEGPKFTCRGQSTDHSFRFCDAAIQNIVSQCSASGNSAGWYDYSWDGVTEHYACVGINNSLSGGDDMNAICKMKGCTMPILP